MALRIAINGFGRIGRLTLRALLERVEPELEIVAINDLSDAETNLHLFNYDSIHGNFNDAGQLNDNAWSIQGHTIQLLQFRNPAELPWKDLRVDLVLECTGLFTERSKAEYHLSAGAKRVLVSAPGTNMDLTVVYGVNHDKLKPEHKIISNASCTTNCLAPLVSVLHQAIGIERGFMTTIHAYTGDQQLVDTYHKDKRRARSAALSMIPSSTGAARAVGEVFPELKGKIDGTAIRVPTPNVSVVDFKFDASRETTVEEIKQALITAADNELKGVLRISDEPLVSSDFNHWPYSSICDISETQVVDKTLCRVLSWYDNEWGFSNRLIDVAKLISKF